MNLAGALMLSLGTMAATASAQGPPPPPPATPPGAAVPLPNLTRAELTRWNLGKQAFLAPATVPGGLGPVFNESSCATCHGGPQDAGGSSLELTTRFGRVVNNQFDPMVAFGGPTLQAKVKGIGKFNGVNFTGEVVPKLATIVVHRRSIPLFGLGLVDAIPSSAIMNLAAHQASVSPNAPGSLIQTLTDFMTFNAPPTPPPAGPPNPTIAAGATIFTSIGCADCHTPTWKTGPSPSTALNNVTFAPYSDFLLHDMGTLGDGMPQGSATPTQMRTAPLWGLKFEPSFLHDGRATTVAQAIQLHAGQGAAASHNYSTLTAAQKTQLLAFLDSL